MWGSDDVRHVGGSDDVLHEGKGSKEDKGGATANQPQVCRGQRIPLRIDFESTEAYTRAMSAGEQLQKSLEELKNVQHAVVCLYP